MEVYTSILAMREAIDLIPASGAVPITAPITMLALSRTDHGAVPWTLLAKNPSKHPT